MLLFALMLALGVFGWYHVRDRYPGYRLDLHLQGDSGFEAGFAAVTITPRIVDSFVDIDSNAVYEPDKGDRFVDRDGDGIFDACWLAGFHRARPALGVHDDLWARAVVFGNSDVRIALVALDAIGFLHDDVITVRQALPPDWRIDHLIICSTHTHSAPDLIGLWGPKTTERGVNEDYRRWVHYRILEALQQAVTNLQPAYLRMARVDSVREGLVADSRPPLVYDDALRILQFVHAATDTTLGTLVCWANHPEALGDLNLWISSDFVHYLREGVEKGLPPAWGDGQAGLGGVALFVNGAIGGLMTPLGVALVDPQTGRHLGAPSFEKARAIGHRVAELVLKALKGEKVIVNRHPRIYLRARTFELPVENFGLQMACLLGVIDRGFSAWKKIRTEIDVLVLGEAWMLTIPGEIYPEIVNGGVENPPGADFQMDPVEVPPLRSFMKGRLNIVFGLANDEIGYIIPKSEWDHWKNPPYLYNSPEPMYGEVVSLGPDTAPLIYQMARDLLKETRERLLGELP